MLIDYIKNRTKHIGAFFILALGIAAVGCHSIEEWDNDIYGNFDALWTIMDEHYCFFEEKGVDWDEIGKRYRAQLSPEMSASEFFDVCADMLAELKDGHTNLISSFNISYYRNWWSDYPQNFDWRLIQEHYLDFDYYSGNGMSYKILADSTVGYVHYSSFSYGISDDFVNTMMWSMKDCKGMILDLRDNGGGNLSSTEDLTSHFIDEKTLAGYISHKTGAGHNDFSEPYPYYYEPVIGVRWLKPVIVLVNRSTYSAANNFVGVMKNLKHVAIAGTTTGGGSGAPFSSELPCGWAVRFSASPIYDANMNLTENGIEPTKGFEIEMNPDEATNGRDSMLDFCINIISNLKTDSDKEENAVQNCEKSLK